MPIQPGFALLTRKSGLDIRSYGAPLDAPSSLLSCASGDGCGALLLGRLHYVDEFLSRVPGLEIEARSGHAALALAAYRMKGTVALERLEGEFSLLIWDLRNRTVVAVRDPLGSYPLFWTRRASDFSVGTTMQPLLEFRSNDDLDPEYPADYLTRPVLALQEPVAEATCYKGIQRIPPGSILTFRLLDGVSAHHRYWRWPELVIDPGTEKTEEIAEQVDALFRPAVRERMAGRTAAHFSGGMDSTSVALIARDWLQAGSGEPLHSVSLVYKNLPTLSGETAYVELALRGQRGVTSHFVAADDLLTYDGFAAAPALDEPLPCLLDLAKESALIEAAAAVGGETVLTGDGGDDFLDVPPYAIAALLRRGRVRAAWKESTRWARAHNSNPWPYFRQFGAEHLLPLCLRAGLPAMLARGRVAWRHQGAGTLAPWIRPDYARKYDLRGRSLRQLHWYFRSARDVGLSTGLAAIQCRVGDGLRWALASPRAMTFSHPFLDPRLLRLGLGIRLRFHQDPGRQKPLLAHAMRDVLPAEIRRRRAKAHFNEVYFKGLARNRASLEQLVRAAPIEDMIDKETLVACLRQTALGAEFSSSGTMRLDLTLSLVKWLSARRGRPGPGAPPAGRRFVPIPPAHN